METKILSDFLTEIKYEDLSKETIEYTKLCLMDFVGVTIAATGNEVERIWDKYFFAENESGESTAIAKKFVKGDYKKVAAYNAACGHLLDLDDVHNTSITHPAAVTIPAALSLAEKYKKSGKDLITAIVAGYEICARVGEAINPGSYWYFHTTGLAGSFSSAVSSGKILGLTKEEMLNSIGSAGTVSAGLWEFMNDGAMSKSLHTATATLNGIRASELAKLGFTGASEILEGKKGFIFAHNKDANPKALVDGLEKGNYKIMTNSFKPYACCRHIHSGNYAIEILKRENNIDVKNISKIIDKTYHVAINTAGITDPKTPYACKFSIPYCLSAMLVYGNLLGDVFSSEKTSNPEVLELAKKVEIVDDPNLNEVFKNDPSCWPHEVEIFMTDGRSFKTKVSYPLGDFMNPFTFEIEEEKFKRITKQIIDNETASEIIDRIKHLDELPDVNDIFKFI